MGGARNAPDDARPDGAACVAGATGIGELCAALERAAPWAPVVRPGSTGNCRAPAAAGFGRITPGEGNRGTARSPRLEGAVRIRLGGDRLVVHRQPARRAPVGERR